MVAGRSISRDELNSTWGNLATELFGVMARIQEAKAVLDGFSAADLHNLFGFDPAESSGFTDATLLKTAAANMGDLAGIFVGNSPGNTLPFDYRTFAKHLLGTGVY